MKQLVVLSIYLWSLIHIIYNEMCVINQTIMNCTNLNLTDCPSANNKAKTLILNGNLLNNFTSSNCLKWSHLEELYIRKNLLVNISNFEQFKELKQLDLSENKLKNLSIESNSLKIINASYNLIERVNLQNNRGELSELYLQNNLINKSNLDILIKVLHSYLKINLLDLSYNKIDIIPVQFMTWDIQNEIIIIFTGNQISDVRFSVFHQISRGIFNFDFSFNNMTSFTIKKDMNIRKINFSNNDLSYIDGKSLNYFKDIQSFDVSHNPLSCLCNVSKEFIQWMNDHKDTVKNQDQTRCKNENVSIFDIKCPDVTSTIQPITSTTAEPITLTNPPLTTIYNQSTSNPIFNNSIKITLATLIPITFIIITVLILFWKFHKKQDYSELVKSKCLSFFSNCCPRNPYTYRNLSSCNQPPHLFDSDENIDSVGSLLVICSSKDTKWIQQIITEIQITHQIINSKVRRLPFFEFILIVVNGNDCLKDYTFINNVEKALQLKDESEIRLLVRKLPNFKKLIDENPLTDYIRDMMHENLYFNYEENCHSTFLERLKLWLNFNV